MTNPEQRQPWLDVLRCLAAYAVIVLHLSGPLLTHPDPNGTILKSAAILSMTLVAWCVPIFVMVSGALNLASKSQVAGAFFRKRWIWIPRTLCWVAIFLGLRFLYEPGLTWHVVMRDLWHGVPYFHLWFLFMLVGLYAVTPALAWSARQTRKTGIFWASAVLIAAAWITATQPNAMGILQTNMFTLFVPFIGYYWLGNVLAELPIHRGFRWVGVVLTATGAAAMMIAEQTQDARLRLLLAPPSEYVFSAFSHPVVLMSIGIFLIGAATSRRASQQTASNARGSSQTCLARIAPLTFGVFVIHPIFLRLLSTLPITIDLPPFAAIWVYAMMVFALSLFVAWALARIPGVQRLIL